jgi:hypothetical protein
MQKFFLMAGAVAAGMIVAKYAGRELDKLLAS